MSDIIIKVDTAELRNKADQILGKRSELEGIMSTMRGHIDSLHSSFKSEEGEDYVKRYSNVESNIQGALNTLKKQIENLNAAADEYDRSKQVQAGIVGSLNPKDTFPSA